MTVSPMNSYIYRHNFIIQRSASASSSDASSDDATVVRKRRNVSTPLSAQISATPYPQVPKCNFILFRLLSRLDLFRACARHALFLSRVFAPRGNKDGADGQVARESEASRGRQVTERATYYIVRLPVRLLDFPVAEYWILARVAARLKLVIHWAHATAGSGRVK